MIAGEERVRDTHTILLKFEKGVSNDVGPLLASANDGRPAPSPAPIAPPPVSGTMSDSFNPGLLRLPAAGTPPPRPRARVAANDELCEAGYEWEE
jgi:hypothetical protein